MCGEKTRVVVLHHDDWDVVSVHDVPQETTVNGQCCHVAEFLAHNLQRSEGTKSGFLHFFLCERSLLWSLMGNASCLLLDVDVLVVV